MRSQQYEQAKRSQEGNRVKGGRQAPTFALSEQSERITPPQRTAFSESRSLLLREDIERQVVILKERSRIIH